MADGLGEGPGKSGGEEARTVGLADVAFDESRLAESLAVGRLLGRLGEGFAIDKELQGSLNSGVILAEVLKAPGHILRVVNDVRDETTLEQGRAPLQHEIATLEAVLFTIAGELFEKFLVAEP